MYNVDNRSDVHSLIIKCEECNAIRGMSNALTKNAFSGEDGYKCSGNHPHLGRDYRKECDEVVSARLRSSSSVYFPANISALTIPPWSKRAVQIIEAAYENIKSALSSFMEVSEVAVSEDKARKYVSRYIEKNVLPKVREPMTIGDLMEAYDIVENDKESPGIVSEADVFSAEYDVLCRGSITADEYVASEAGVPAAFRSIFERVTVVEKLTVINALIGFTRIEPWDGKVKNNPHLAPLSVEKKKWLPAVKLLGEGIFIQFSREALDLWQKRAAGRYDLMSNQLGNSGFVNERFSPEYVALHTFAHLLIRQLSEDCGYSASSLREKIYCTFNDDANQTDMRGALVYLSTSDAEGSLGGLTSIGRDPKRLQSILKNMLQKALWCSADPFCSRSTQQGFSSLNYAACHDCVLLPETSCEFRNVLLDRIAVVGAAENPELGLLGNIAQELLK